MYSNLEEFVDCGNNNYINLLVLLAKINTTQISCKMHKKSMNSKLPNWHKTSLDFKFLLMYKNSSPCDSYNDFEYMALVEKKEF